MWSFARFSGSRRVTPATPPRWTSAAGTTGERRAHHVRQIAGGLRRTRRVLPRQAPQGAHGGGTGGGGAGRKGEQRGTPRAGRQSPRLRGGASARSEEHTSELQSREKLVCRLL